MGRGHTGAQAGMGGLLVHSWAVKKRGGASGGEGTEGVSRASWDTAFSQPINPSLTAEGAGGCMFTTVGVLVVIGIAFSLFSVSSLVKLKREGLVARSMMMIEPMVLLGRSPQSMCVQRIVPTGNSATQIWGKYMVLSH